MSRHHHLLISVLTIPLIACSAIPGTTGGTKAPRANNVADSYGEATELPVSLKNMKKLGERLDAELTRLEEGTSTGKISSPRRDIVSARTTLISYYGYGHKGGSEECEACKNHPTFSGLKDNYSRLDERLRALEVKYEKCTYGYQMDNGDILKPTYDWSPEEWASIRKKSKHGTSRCWLISDPEHYYNSNE
jgi:hypothetical protein